MNNIWNERYANTEFAYGKEPNEFLKAELKPRKPGKILLVCEGEGRNAVYAAKLGWDVDAFDLSEEGYKKAMLLAEEESVKINYKLADATVVQYPEGVYDAVVFIYAHFPVEIRKAIHEKACKWLKPGGIILLEAFNYMQVNNTSGGPKDPSMLYTQKMMEYDFNSLNIQKINYESIILNEGKFHSGKADVIRLLAQKP